MKKVLLLVLTLVFVLSLMPVHAAELDVDEVEVLIPFGAGGTSDVTARRFQVYLAEELGVNIVPLNVPGAGGRVCANRHFNNPPDGSVIMVHNLPTINTGEIAYDPDYKVSDFVPIYGITSEGRAVAVHPDSDFESFQDIMDESQNRPLTMAGVGYGATDHILSILLQEKGLNHVYIPFGSGAEAARAVMGGHTDFAAPAASSGLPYYQDGQINVVAISTEESPKGYEDVPTLVEEGCDIILTTDTGLFGPPGMDEEIVAIFEEAFNGVMENEDYLEDCRKADAPLYPRTAEEWEKAVMRSHRDISSIEDLVKEAVGAE